MLNRRTLTLVVAALIWLGACASSGQSGGAGRSRDLITSEELMEVPYNTVFEAVRALRPRWLQARNVASLVAPRPSQARHSARVYVDGHFRGELNELSRLVPHEVAEIRFMSASDATTRFGTNHIAGAIVVTTRRR